MSQARLLCDPDSPKRRKGTCNSKQSMIPQPAKTRTSLDSQLQPLTNRPTDHAHRLQKRTKELMVPGARVSVVVGVSQAIRNQVSAGQARSCRKQTARAGLLLW